MAGLNVCWRHSDSIGNTDAQCSISDDSTARMPAHWWRGCLPSRGKAAVRTVALVTAGITLALAAHLGHAILVRPRGSTGNYAVREFKWLGEAGQNPLCLWIGRTKRLDVRPVGAAYRLRRCW